MNNEGTAKQRDLSRMPQPNFLPGAARMPCFCTWGNMDLLELQRNMDYYHMENPFSKPLLYYDVQEALRPFCRENANLS